MFSLEAEDIYDVAKPLHVCSKVLGLTTFSIIKVNKTYWVHTSNLNLFFVLLSTTWNLVFAVLYIFDFGDFWNMSEAWFSKVFLKSIMWVIFVLLLTTVITNWWIFLSQKHFPVILNLLLEIDEELSKLKVPIDVKKQRRSMLIFVIIHSGFVFVAYILSELVGQRKDIIESSPVMLITLTLSMHHTLFTIFQFTLLMSAVKLRYKKINKFLSINFLLCSNENIENGNEKLNLAASLHEKLVDVSESINRCYGVPVSDDL